MKEEQGLVQNLRIKSVDGEPSGLILLEPTLTQKTFSVFLRIQKVKSRLQLNKRLERTLHKSNTSVPCHLQNSENGNEKEKCQNPNESNHAFYEIVYSFSAIASLAARPEILLRRPLETLLRRVQLENWLNSWQFSIVDFAFGDCGCKIAYGFASYCLSEFVCQFLVTRQPSSFCEQVNQGFFGDFAPGGVTLHAFQHAKYRGTVSNKHATIRFGQKQKVQGFSGFALCTDCSANLHHSKALGFCSFFRHFTSPSPSW